MRAIKITQNEVKLERTDCSNTSAKMVKQNLCIKKTDMFTIIASNFVREQLKSQICLTKNDPAETCLKTEE